jgi:hypothetical protein
LPQIALGAMLEIGTESRIAFLDVISKIVG